ncbi:hypothetical protein [Gelidibacter pelagius]|uniref:Gliding motility-associated lipoprotein GldH n=1 Tax=Gelidibacter pelagius TaxID=2819985 RepID=A0ABS3SNA6_9FLAO|nr:hypothetical protein [Gelidibacter pelagius]MBO3097180.1 hypothetical protein [Gelidibacter pelagius]
MNKKVLFTLFLMVSMFISSCSSKDDDCTKTLEMPHYALENHRLNLYYVAEEVPCDFVAHEDKGPLELKNFTYKVLYFTFTTDTSNNTSRLKFEIKLNNPNNYAVEGLAILTIRPVGDGFEYTGNYSSLASVPCHNIAANSSCTLTFDQEYPFNPDLGAPQSLELVSVKYYVAT